MIWKRISLVVFILLLIAGFLGIYYLAFDYGVKITYQLKMTGKLESEETAAILNAIVSIPGLVFTLVGTVGVTAYFSYRTLRITAKYNNENIKLMKKTQRQGLRDKILEKRLHISHEIEKKTALAKKYLRGFMNHFNISDWKKFEEYNKYLVDFYYDNFHYLHMYVQKLIQAWLFYIEAEEKWNDIDSPFGKISIDCYQKYYLDIINDKDKIDKIKNENKDVSEERINDLINDISQVRFLIRLLPQEYLPEYLPDVGRRMIYDDRYNDPIRFQTKDKV
ncbi:hypothetical protein [Thermoactinomyces sp. CICC 10521]|uniref:hypothetical protein n=1 Tax=Thermoactinomyces sp. CICC 10521 TaxID=2767426 RepID=UPI0018DCDF0E|nr:hypothetical protein [Thermoactinomyces sp. CICC 10521]MBH8608773.1 hypothetical protein [Thermoactinomyces sp. CICC 10521]